ncbi:MAG: hypothetical protein ACD_21C00015G0003 [uncultured bacterium]|nr:MAG: hypothetical protein ACD_21C00015G0003 [uncultured bacterium]
MKVIINKILHWLSISIISLMLVLVVLLTSLHFANPYLKTHQHDLEKFASDLMQHPVSISSVTAGNSGLEPVLKLHDVTIFNNAKTKILLRASELQIGIDLIGSLIKWSIKPGLLVARGFSLSINQDKSGKISISGIKATLDSSVTAANFEFDEILGWLFDQSKIELTDVALIWNLADGEVLKFTNLDLQLYNGILRRDLKINGRLVQKKLPAKFNLDLKLRGDILRQDLDSLTGDVIVEDWTVKLPQSSGKGFSFAVIPKSGDINLTLRYSQVVSSLFRQPLSFDKLKSKIVWQDSKGALDVRISKLKYRDNWLALHGDLKLLFPTDQAGPVVDIQTEFKLTNLARAKLYYPAPLMPPDGVAWLDQAFVSSKPMTGTVVMQGPVAKFPFDNNEGRFIAKVDIRDVHLNYNNDWPSLVNITGKMIFANRSMTIEARNAKITQAPVEFVKAVIPDLDVPILSIDSKINTDASIGLKFVDLSPLKQTLAKKLHAINLMGPMQLLLQMSIPLSPLAKQKETEVDGNIVLHNNYLRPYKLNFGISNVNGELRFTENDFTADKISGDLFGKPVHIKINTLKANKGDAITQVSMVGSATIKDIEKAFAVRLEPYVLGNFQYKGLLKLHGLAEENTFNLHSNLQGIAIDLPEPFAKAAASASKFDATYYFDNEFPRLMVNYNDQINAALAIKKSSAQSSGVLFGEIKVGGAPARVPTAPGMAISGKIKQLDWSVWRNYFSKVEQNFPKGGATIQLVSLNIGELRALGQTLTDLALQARPKGNGWDVALSMPAIQGRIFFPGGVGEQIQGNFQKFYYNFSKEQQSLATVKPQELLPMHFIINDFRYGNKKLSRVEFSTQHLPTGLKIDKFAIDDPNFNLNASGDWLMVGDAQQSFLRGWMSSSNIGELLKQLELTNDLIGGKGEANFSLKWSDAPYSPSLQKVRGSFVMNAKSGQIINLSGKTEAKLGLSKILNMFSLRHLTLDFGDLTKKGFGFDKMTGDIVLTGGNALVNNIMFNGPSAKIFAQGKIGLAAQSYDLILRVTPHITSSIPAAATVIGGPVIGVLSWFVTDIIVDPMLKKITTYTYHVTGSWDNPVVTKQ